ncbi:hypothetical protein DRQ36_05010 [bacterium]|nr:MAG: hypothetical protein DRQ36_05010 [bacterium]
MSYEAEMLKKWDMPPRKEVERELLREFVKHGGVVAEFASGQEIVKDIADYFALTEEQRNVPLERIYKKENRVVKTPLWHRLLFRAADSLAKEKLLIRPSQTIKLTKKKEWMLTEKGFDRALKLSDISAIRKENLPTKSYEVQKIVKKLNESRRPEKYIPFDKKKKAAKVTREAVLRTRAFRLAVTEAYSYRCAVCGLKISSPDSLSWEVEAAHIVPHSHMGRDDIWNGIALCHLHHWAFDVGWFTLRDDYTVEVSSNINSLPADFGKIRDYELFRILANEKRRIFLPNRNEIYPHINSIIWHRQNVFVR